MMTIEQAREMRAQMEQTFAAAAQTMTDDETIANRALCAKWSPGVYAAGDVRRTDTGLFKCCQAHDSTANEGWTPETTPALWSPYHGTTAETALPFVQPSGAQDMYKTGEYMIYTDGITYRCVQDTSFSPDEYAQAWEAVT